MVIAEVGQASGHGPGSPVWYPDASTRHPPVNDEKDHDTDTDYRGHGSYATRRQAAKLLAQKGEKVRALVRNPEKAAALQAAGVESRSATRAIPPRCARH